MRTRTLRLDVEDIMDINDAIFKVSRARKDVEYGAHDDYPIRLDKLKALVDMAPDAGLDAMASYYLKNIILLQAHPDANHRTAFAAVELFLRLNGCRFDYSVQDAEAFQRAIYRARFAVYGTYEEMGTEVLSERENDVHRLCLEFVRAHLSQGD